MRHLPIPEQVRYLRLVLNRFYKYYAVPTNSGALNAFYYGHRHRERPWPELLSSSCVYPCSCS
jgi:hypothetical protein